MVLGNEDFVLFREFVVELGLEFILFVFCFYVFYYIRKVNNKVDER